MDEAMADKRLTLSIDTARPTGGRRVRAARRRGFTMLEVLIALVLTASLLSGVYMFFENVIRARKEAGAVDDDSQLRRYTLERIAEDVRYAAGYVPGFGVGLTGTRHSITIYRYVMPEADVFNEYDPQLDTLPPAKHDLRRVDWDLRWDEELKDEQGYPICHGIRRSSQTTLNQIVVTDEGAGELFESADFDRSGADAGDASEPDASTDAGAEAPPEPSGVERDLVAPEFKFLEFHYFDGAEWVEDWAGGQAQENSLPQAIMITIGRVPVPPEEELKLDSEDKPFGEAEEQHPDRFSIIVRLPMADRFLASRMVNARNRMSDDISENMRSDTESFQQRMRGGGLGSTP